MMEKVPIADSHGKLLGYMYVEELDIDMGDKMTEIIRIADNNKSLLGYMHFEPNITVTEVLQRLEKLEAERKRQD